MPVEAVLCGGSVRIVGRAQAKLEGAFMIGRQFYFYVYYLYKMIKKEDINNNGDDNK